MNKIKLTTKEELLNLNSGDELEIQISSGRYIVTVTHIVGNHLYYNYNSNDDSGNLSIDMILKGESHVKEVYKVLDECRVYKSLSEENFSSLIGRKFKVWFRNISEVKYHKDLDINFCMTLKSVEGYLENFHSTGHVVLNSEKDGFNIIPYMCVVQMLEIKE